MSRVERLYERLPLPMQNWAVNFQGWMFETRRSDPHQIRAFLDRLRVSEHWTAQQFAAFQEDMLAKTLEIAFQRIPYYQRKRAEWNLDLAQPTWDLFHQIPILEKSELREFQSQFVDPSIPEKDLVRTSTSGTTGTPLTIFQTQTSVSERFAYVARLRQWAGLSDPIRPRRAQFTGRTIVPDSQPAGQHVYWRTNRPNNALLFSTVHLCESTVPAYLKALQDFQPELIDGYPSALLILARLGRQMGLEGPRPKAIIVSAETVLPEHRTEIESFFGCNLFDQYAGSEPSCFWMDCEHGHMHISPEYGISEILREDGTPCKPGETGDVVVTSFINPVMPLLRYRIGDSAVVGPEDRCPCGRSLPRIERIMGRLDDILYTEERGYVGRLDPVFKGLTSIVEAQIVQESLEHIVILLVPAQGYSEAIGQKLMHQLRDKVGNKVQIDLKLVEAIPRGANGKFRSVVSKCRDQYPASM